MKTNLLLFLTPYIIRDASDFRRIFERKMAERQQFVEEFYGQVPGYDVPIDFGRKPGRWRKMNQLVMREELKVENGGPGFPGEQRLPARPGSPGATPAAAAGGPRAAADDDSDGPRLPSSPLRAGCARQTAPLRAGAGTGTGRPRGPGAVRTRARRRRSQAPASRRRRADQSAPPQPPSERLQVQPGSRPVERSPHA